VISLNINRKGFTIVELILSFALISVIVIGMLTIVINYRSMVKISNRKIELVQYKNTVTKQIQDDITSYGVEDVSYCKDASGNNIVTCVTFTFQNNTTKNLLFSNSNVKNRYIQYGGEKFPIQEAGQDDFTSLSDAMIHLPSERTGITFDSQTVNDVTVYKVRIPIITDDIDNDFGLFIVATDAIIKEENRTVTDELFKTENLGNNCTTYNDGTDTFLVGQCSNNYVWYSGKLWRVVLKNNETGAVKMVTENAITSIPYNVSGNTSFANSYMDQWLNQEFLPTLHDYEDYLVVNSVWDATLTTSSSTKPAGTTTVERAVGLLNVYEYYTTYAQSGGVATYDTGYLVNGAFWWLITPYSPSNLWRLYGVGILAKTPPTNGYGARPSINLKSTVQIDSGSGSETNPYILNGDKQEIIAGTTLLSTRYSGEYVTFNNELYRIVGVENGLTKITAVDKPSGLASNVFDSSDSKTTNFANASIKTDLESYYQGLNNTWKRMIQPSTTWYLASVGDGTSYKASICSQVDVNTSTQNCTKTSTTTTASIALPRLGEMFTSLITRANLNTAAFWTLTPHSTSDVRYMDTNGIIDKNSSTFVYGARPSMYLKSTVKIASDNTGNGTYEKPYKLSM